MTLEKLFCMIPEEQIVIVLDNEDGEEIARYDGRESIPKALNRCKVASITAGGSWDLRVYVE